MPLYPRGEPERSEAPHSLMSSSELATQERKRDYSRLTRGEVAALLSLHRAGKTQPEIALALGCNVSTVSRWLDKLDDTTELAKQVTRNAAQRLAERVIEQADVEQSLEVLDRLDVLPKKRDEGGKSAVQINIGMAGQPVGRDPLDQVNVISNYQTQTISEGETGQ